jgi:hypothetical protein
MADYVNYSVVSWTDATPITSVRLNQMSTNIEQVKIANEDKPKGIVKYKSTTPNVGTTVGTQSDVKLVIALENTGGVDNRVTLDPTRYYRFVFNIRALAQSASGDDGRYEIYLVEGNTASNTSPLFTWTVSSPVTYRMVTSGSSAPDASTVPYAENNTYFAGGKYEHVESGLTKTNQSYSICIQRFSGAVQSSTGLPIWATHGVAEFYIEDIGGVA